MDYYRRATALVRRTRPAIIHCNDYNTMWIGVAARALWGTPVVYDAHELWPDRNLRPEPRWWLLACEFIFVRLAQRTITPSPGYAETMARRYRIRPPRVIRNIPSRTDLREQAMPGPSAAQRPQRSTGGIVSYVGALTRNRGLEISIRAISRVPDVQLRLIGQGLPSYRQELVTLAEREGVSNRVDFAAPVPPSEVIEELRDAAAGLALIQPACLSYRLSLPNKLFEYVAAGIPVLASDLPVIGEFVRSHEIGVLARPDDVSDVAGKLRQVLEPERNLRFRRGAYRARAEIRWEREADLLVDVYRETITAGGGGSP